MGRLVLLGPQRSNPDLVSVVDAEGAEDPFAAVTAGWEEREDEIDELRDHLARRVRNLRLWHRAEEAFAEDADLLAAWRERRARLRELHEVYRRRLTPLCESVRELGALAGRSDVLDPEREDALALVRALDARHRERVHEVVREFESRASPLERPALARRREEVRRVLADCPSVAIAGGHVGVLGNRLRLFGLADALEDKVVFAWSAGAMVAVETVVLFHDFPPQGAGWPEVLGPGLALGSGIVPLPHAARRLALDDRDRVAFFARRFAPSTPVPLDPGAVIALEDGRWTSRRPRSTRLEPDGSLAEPAFA